MSQEDKKKEKRPYVKGTDTLEKLKLIESELEKFYDEFHKRFGEFDKNSQLFIVFSSLFWTVAIHICVWICKFTM